MEENDSRDQSGAQKELARILAQQAANDAARRKLEQQLSAALTEATRSQNAHADALKDAQSQVTASVIFLHYWTAGSLRQSVDNAANQPAASWLWLYAIVCGRYQNVLP